VSKNLRRGCAHGTGSTNEKESKSSQRKVESHELLEREESKPGKGGKVHGVCPCTKHHEVDKLHQHLGDGFAERK
jgi:hypothetical protein